MAVGQNPVKRSRWEHWQWELGLYLTVLAWLFAFALMTSTYLTRPLRGIGVVTMLLAGSHYVLYRWPRLLRVVALATAGITLGTVVKTMDTGLGLLLLPGGVLLTLGAHKLWAEGRTPPPAPPRHGDGSGSGQPPESH